MGKITGNENSFPTIKQVNDALSGGAFDISSYCKSLFDLEQTTSNKELNDDNIKEMLERIIVEKPTIITGETDYFNDTNFKFKTTNIEWCETNIDGLKNYIITFKIYMVIYGGIFNFIFLKILDDFYYIYETKSAVYF